jgi:hypothetical protein
VSDPEEAAAVESLSDLKPSSETLGWSWMLKFFGPEREPVPGHLWPRWLFLRGLGLIFFSAFYSLAFQIRGLIGPRGILPAGDYLSNVSNVLTGIGRYIRVPTLLWVDASDRALTALVLVGGLAALALVVNLWPRLAILICEVTFLSFVVAAQDFSAYQSDGMLLEAGFIALFFAPRGLRPGLGVATPPSPASLFLLRWEWFRIYFESGLVKLLSGEPQWRHLTAMDHYYENGPLPTWPGWYVQQLPHGFHVATALATLVIELGIAWCAWLPRRVKIVCFCIVTPFQIGIILTANYAFLNYLVLLLGVLLLDDRILARFGFTRRSVERREPPQWRLAASALVLLLFFWATVSAFAWRRWPVLGWPARLTAPYRIANSYGLFAVMTRARYEIEFQARLDGDNWVPYPFRYKPQDPTAPPGIYAPYQPRFEWNLWFASLANWRQDPWVVFTELRLLDRSPPVLHLFAEDPLHGRKPVAVRAVLWRYWFTDRATKKRTGRWWNRERLGLYAPVAERTEDGGERLVLRGEERGARSEGQGARSEGRGTGWE